MSITDIIKKILYNMNLKPFLKNYILMESNPDYSDNTRAVFEELIKQKYNQKCKIIWFVDEKEKYDDIKIKNVKFIKRNKKMRNFIIFLYYNLFAKYIIDCNKYIRKLNKNQFRIHLTHGAFIKITPGYSQSSGEFDYVIQLSDFFTDSVKKMFKINENKIITTGFPRNDIFFEKEKNTLNVFPEIKRKKDILWLPTYRKHKNDSNQYYKSFKFGVPSIDNDEEIKELNEMLKKDEILLIIKLHPAEDDSKISKLELSNIKLIKDTIFEKKHFCLNDLLTKMDALITDYSSVYYDFLLTGKPIGLAITDIDEYKEKVGLIFENYEKNIQGEHIYNFSDLKKFINNIANENDIKYKERIEKVNLYHKYQDGNSSKRVVEILKKRIEEEMNEKRN